MRSMKKRKQAVILNEKGISTLPILAGVVVIAILAIAGWYLYSRFSSSRHQVPVPITQQTGSEKGVLRVGENIDEFGLEADRKEFQPFINYLVSKLGRYGITSGEF